MGSYEDKKEKQLGYQDAIEAFEHLCIAYRPEVERRALKIMRKYLDQECEGCSPAYIDGFTESLLFMETVEELKFTTPMPMPAPDFKAPSFCPSKEMLEVHFKMAQVEDY